MRGICNNKNEYSISGKRLLRCSGNAKSNKNATKQYRKTHLGDVCARLYRRYTRRNYIE